jgi:LacI family transcriptional regulator
MATIYDVARRAQVSAATVSRVLNGHPSVDPELAARVHAAVAELHYRPNAVARSLRKSRTSLIAVIISDVTDPALTATVRGVEDLARETAYSVVLCDSDEDPDREAEYVSAALAEQMAGVIIASSGRDATIEQLVNAGTPVVAVDRAMPGATVDAVLIDTVRGAEQATTHLIEAGYNRIACITGPPHLATAGRPLQGYERALRAAGRMVDPELVKFGALREPASAPFGPVRATEGYESMAALLRSAPRLDAVLVANGVMTIGVLECLLDQGVDVPGEIGVVGFDDPPWARLANPPLSTVAEPRYELGNLAARLLVERIGDPSRPPVTVSLRTELRVRASSRPV